MSQSLAILGAAGVLVLLPALAAWYTIRTLYRLAFPPKSDGVDRD